MGSDLSCAATSTGIHDRCHQHITSSLHVKNVPHVPLENVHPCAGGCRGPQNSTNNQKVPKPNNTQMWFLYRKSLQMKFMKLLVCKVNKIIKFIFYLVRNQIYTNKILKSQCVRLLTVIKSHHLEIYLTLMLIISLLYLQTLADIYAAVSSPGGCQWYCSGAVNHDDVRV